MSRTDKTAPYNAKALYYPSWVVEYHDHRTTECDLPDRPTYDNVGWLPNGQHCGWVYSQEFMCSSMARCSCDMCGYDAYDSIPLRKRQRIEGRRYCKGGWMDEY